MAHFAELDKDNKVIQVMVIDNSELLDESSQEQESKGKTFLSNLLGSDRKWVQTSYNHRIRKQYAGIGYYYDSDKDKFIAPRPFPSWSLGENDDWQAPVPYPDDGDSRGGNKKYSWDEETTSWFEVDLG